MSNGLGLMIESLVAVLLLLTITFCIVLNGRLKKLKADEQALKATISELITATEIAERAIAGLKMTVRDCDQNLSERLRAGDAHVGGGNRVVSGKLRLLYCVPDEDPVRSEMEQAFAAEVVPALNPARC